ncbi:MAG: NUDIX hydrolase [Thermoplasmata archaeon]
MNSAEPRMTAGASLEPWLAPWSLLTPPRDRAGAAVLIILREGPDGPQVLLIERAMRPGRSGSGQVGFPGGHVEPGDDTLRTTALRECEEEVGLSAAHFQELPRYVGTRYASAFGLQVAIFVAPLAPYAPAPTARDPREVAATFWLPRLALEVTRMEPRETLFGPYPMPSAVHEGHVVWGFTRRVLREFFGLPREPLYDPRQPPEHGIDTERHR